MFLKKRVAQPVSNPRDNEKKTFNSLLNKLTLWFPETSLISMFPSAVASPDLNEMKWKIKMEMKLNHTL